LNQEEEMIRSKIRQVNKCIRPKSDENANFDEPCVSRTRRVAWVEISSYGGKYQA